MVAWLGGVRVGVANIWERSYKLEDGSARTGLTAQLMLDDGEDEIVGEGSRIEIGRTRFRVIEVGKAEHERGYVRFRPVR